MLPKKCQYNVTDKLKQFQSENDKNIAIFVLSSTYLIT